MSTFPGLTNVSSSPSLHSLGQSRSSSQLYGSTNGGSTGLPSTSLSSSRLNQFASGLNQNSTTSSLGLNSSNRGLSQPSSLTNGFLNHQSSPSSSLNSKFSPGLGNSLSSNNFGSNSFGSNFGNNIMNILGSTSPSSFGTSTSTQASSQLFGSQQPSGGGSHIFGSSLNSNNNNSGPYNSSQFSNNGGYSSFSGSGFSPSLEMSNSTMTTESLDLSEFPSLQAPAKQMAALRLDPGNTLAGLAGSVSVQPGGFSLNSTNGPFAKSVTGSKTYSEVSNTNLAAQNKPENSPGFQISHEDFPALPGAPKPSHPIASHQMLPTDLMSQIAPTQPEAKPVSMLNKPSKTSIVLPNFPPSMCKDQFGIAGLLAFIRTKDSCPKLIKFALGMDLCDLGLNLHGEGKLHRTFQSPWADRPCGPHHLEQSVPSDYRNLEQRLKQNLTRTSLSDRDRIKKYGEDLLFWLYYNNIGTTIQLLAIQELQNRGWMYYIPERMWITKALGKEAPKGHFGTWCWFDVTNWKKAEREMSVEPDKVEFSDKQQQFRL